MYCARRKYRKVLVWICLVAVGQAIFSMFLYEEFNFAPIRHGWTTKTFANEIKTRLRLQSQDVEHTEANLKFIARAKLDHSRKKEESMDFKRSVLIKSASFQLSGNREKHHYSLGEIRRSNQGDDLSVRISDQERRGHKLSHHDLKYANEKNAGHEFRTETNNTEIKDVFISVKTTGEFHKTRVQILLDTWVQNAKNQVKSLSFFVDHSFDHAYFLFKNFLMPVLKYDKLTNLSVTHSGEYDLCSHVSDGLSSEHDEAANSFIGIPVSS